MAKATNDPDQSQTTGSSSSDADDERLDQLARQFLELWRQQVAATADGAHAASAIGRLYASLGADTTRMGEGFEAWGKLIGQMAMGQHPAAGPGNPINNPMGDAMAAANPLQAMMDQMAKAARELPASPFAGMPFASDMSAMAGMAGMTPKPDTAKAEPDAAGNADGQTSDKDSAQTSAADEANKTSKTKRAAKNAAKGQGKNDQSAKTKTASAKTRKSEAGRAKTASDASGSRDDELAQLARRIADLSETIAALEAGTEGSGGKSSG
ncbi:MAG: hypothetical protein CMO07_16870 [Thalassospira sp.]|uniref:hypothetical protein n=1 Tax=unclassified Thalassospira TaxID=2648997 RepID=UPI000C4A57B0|nr:hypothetical protein [Thalassospira sp. UBA4513]MBE70555.1 hypothetical protein [Thalassospira sp.]MBE72342.1 hypothetical protein [Thalassospira sp.]|tara:strand:- start:1180 stop:1983 length:804 start_codon:yes stop_codon:yes gene_type:complete